MFCMAVICKIEGLGLIGIFVIFYGLLYSYSKKLSLLMFYCRKKMPAFMEEDLKGARLAGSYH